LTGKENSGLDPEALKCLELAIEKDKLQPLVDYICQNFDILDSPPDYEQIAASALRQLNNHLKQYRISQNPARNDLTLDW
jgi:hypothetical protein